MPKRIMKLTETLATVKIDGTGTETITLNADLLSPTQELADTQHVGIQFLQWTTGGNIAISRGGVNLYTLFGGSVFDLSGHGGMLDTEQSDQNITVTITGNGTILMNLRKMSGYNSKIEPWAFGQYDNPNVVGS